MNSLIEELVNYQKSGCAGPLLKEIENEVGSQDLRLLSIKVLSWLRAEDKRRTSRPLVLSDYPWCKLLKKLISEYSSISDIFEINGNEMTYSKDLTSKQIEVIAKTAAVGYNPPIMK